MIFFVIFMIPVKMWVVCSGFGDGYLCSWKTLFDSVPCLVLLLIVTLRCVNIAATCKGGQNVGCSTTDKRWSQNRRKKYAPNVFRAF